MGPSVASRIPFHDLCNLCEKLSSSSREKRLAMFSKYVAFFRDFGEKMKEQVPDVDTSFYPVLRLLLPQLDRDRGAYGVKAHGLANVLIRVLCLAKDGQDAAKLLNFKAPKTAGAQAGDFAEVAFFVLKKRCSAGRTLTVEQVNAHLDNVALKHAAGNPRGIDDELTTVLKEMSAQEAKWLIMMLLKDVKVGLGQTAVLNTFHPDAVALYDVCNSLHKVCATLDDPSRRLHEVEVSLFTPFRPMLAQQCDVREVASCFTSAAPTYYLETKYDGERFQLHYGDGVFRYFSKRGHDYTEVFGADCESGGSLTPQLWGCLRRGLRSCILDGEMMAWDCSLGAFRSKGDGVDVKALRAGGGGSSLRPCLCVFDVLLVDGAVLTDRPLKDRLELLGAAVVAAPREGVLQLTRREEVSAAAHVEAAVDDAVERELEGVMLKDPASRYRPNQRRGGWLKVKPEYSEGLADELDALVVGGYYGEGRRGGHVSHFLLAAAAPDDRRLLTLARVGSGYSDHKLRELLARLAPHWTPLQPPGVVCAKEKPDVWVQPEASFLLQVKASELVESSAFATGVTLRFPRVTDVRHDKLWHEGVTTDQLAQLSRRLCSRRVGDVKAAAARPSRRRAASPTLAPHFRAPSPTAAAATTEVGQGAAPLAGRELCVLTGGAGRTKHQVEADVLALGGRLVQNPGPRTWCLLGELGGGVAGAARVSNAVRAGRWDVARVSWLYQGVGGGAAHVAAEWTPGDLLGATPATRALLARRYDAYGDSYTAPVTEERLRELVEGVDVAHAAHVDLAEVDVELFGGPSPYAPFRLCRALFAPCPPEDTAAQAEMRVLALDWALYGGDTSAALEDATTHVVVHSRCPQERWRRANKLRTRKVHVVGDAWVRACVLQRRRLPERHRVQPDLTFPHQFA